MVTSDSIYDSCSDSKSTEERPYDSEEMAYDLEVKDLPNTNNNGDSDQGELEEAYAYELLADAEWLALYEAKRMEEKELEEKLQKRLTGKEKSKNGKLQRELRH